MTGEMANILIVDDDPTSLDILGRVASGVENVAVTAATCGREALAHLATTDFALVILDVCMPGESGFDVVNRLKKQKKNRDTPIIFLTAFSTDEQSVSEGYGLGAVDYITKPYHAETLRSKIRVFTELHRQRAALTKKDELLTKVGRMALIGGWEFEIGARRLTWTDEIYRILDAAEEYEPDVDAFVASYAPESRKAISEALERCAETGEPFKLESAFTTAKGRDLWVRTMGEPRFENGEVVAVSGTVQDITEYKKGLDAVQESEERFRSLYESIRDAILVADTDRRIIDLNPAFTALFGYTLEDLKGRKTLIIYENEEEFRQLGLKLQRKARDPAVIVAVNYKKKTGETFPGETNAFPLMNARGEITGFIGLIRDISERIKAEKEIASLARFPAENPQPVLRVDENRVLIFANRGSEYVMRSLDMEVGGPLAPELWQMAEPSFRGAPSAILDLKIGERVYSFSFSEVTGQRDVSIYGQDVTEAKKAAESLKQRAFELEIVQDLSRKLGYTLDYEDMIKLMLEHLPSVMDFDVGAGLLIREDAARTYNLESPTLDPALRREIAGKMREAVIRFSDGEIAPEVSDFEAATCAVPVRDGGIAAIESHILVPLFHQLGGVIGVLYIGAEREGAFEAGQVGMLFKVAEQASSSIASLRALVEEHKQDLTQLVRALPHGVVLLDAERTVVMANRKGRDKLRLLAGIGEGETLAKLDGVSLDEIVAAQNRGEPCYVEHAAEERKQIFEIAWNPLVSGPQAGGMALLILDVTREQTAAAEIKASERKFRAMFDNASDAIFVYDPQGRILDVNDVACKRLGYSREELTGMTSRDLAPDGLAGATLLESRWNNIRERGFAIFETSQKRRDGVMTPIEINARLIDYEGAKAVLATARDITERKLIEQQRVEHAVMLNAILSGIRAAFFILDPETLVVSDVNEQAAAFLGMSKEALIGKKCPELLGANICGPAGAEDSAGATFVDREAKITLPDGAIVPVAMSRLNIRMGGESCRAVILFDITEQKSLERQLAYAQKLESIGQLAAGIAHEINTPVQYISSNIVFFQESFNKIRVLLKEHQKLLAAAREQNALAEFLPQVERAIETANLEFLLEEVPQALEDSKEGVGRVATIVRSIKKFSHPDLDQIKPVDINDAIRNTVIVARNEWKYDSTVVENLDDGLPMALLVPGDFNQVILNILVNAAHAVSDKVRKTGEKGVITVSTSSAGEFVEVRIADTGEGIASEHRARIYDPFFTTKEVGKGTGQGLAITYSIVKKHGGTIDFESEPGEGTTFILRFPIKPTCNSLTP